MLKLNSMAKEAARGVFWIIEGELVAYPVIESEFESAVSGLTYNHKRLWTDIKPRGDKHPYNYWPRGRVDFTNKGKPVIYYNPNIDIENYLQDIKIQFGLRDTPRLHPDGSQHYKCYLDEGWVPAK